MILFVCFGLFFFFGGGMIFCCFLVWLVCLVSYRAEEVQD